MSATQLSFDVVTPINQDLDSFEADFARQFRGAVDRIVHYLEHPDPRELEPSHPRDLYDEWCDDRLTGHVR